MEITKESYTESQTKPDGPPGPGPEPGGPEPAIGWGDALGEHVQNPPEARTQGRCLFEPDGTTHLISPDENGIKGQFELWVQNNALKCIADVEARGRIDQADRMMSIYIGDHGAGHYTWDGKHVQAARFLGATGFIHLLWLLMVRCDPQKTESDVRELMRKYPRQCGELMGWALGNCLAPETRAGAAKRNGTASQLPRQKQWSEAAGMTRPITTLD